MSSDLTRSEFPPSGKGHKRQRQRNKAKPHNKTEYSTTRWGGGGRSRGEVRGWEVGSGAGNPCQLLTCQRLLARVRAMKEDSPQGKNSSCHSKVLELQMHSGISGALLPRPHSRKNPSLSQVNSLTSTIERRKSRVREELVVEEVDVSGGNIPGSNELRFLM